LRLWLSSFSSHICACFVPECGLLDTFWCCWWSRVLASSWCVPWPPWPKFGFGRRWCCCDCSQFPFSGCCSRCCWDFTMVNGDSSSVFFLVSFSVLFGCPRLLSACEFQL